MKIVIFAGGVGSRLWPLSRKSTPKQFEKIIGDKSTLQQTVARIVPEFSPTDIYIATGVRYKDTVINQLPQIPKENFIFEPEMRDVGPAIGLISMILAKKFPDEPFAILWSDHLVKNIEAFRFALRSAEQVIHEKKGTFVFIGQKPRFANQNIGWIELGPEVKRLDETTLVSHFIKLRYRPKLSEAVTFFENKNFIWNLGYFVTTPRFICDQFKKFVPSMYEGLSQIQQTYETASFEKTLTEIYPTLEKISFDDAILEKLQPDDIYVISSDIGWSDVGAWEALKEALSTTEEENVTNGNVIIEDSRDSLLFNYTKQLAVGIDLEEMIVINTDDVLLVCPKTSVPKIKKLVESLAGTQHEHLT